MTIILTCLTEDYIVQASDRRLTRAEEVTDDHSNKALIYCNHFVFAYMGLAELDNQYPSAIDWAAQQLSERENLEDAVLHLGNRASDLMNSDRIRNFYSRYHPSKKRLAFVGAGFADDEKGNRRPLRIVISNFFRREDSTWTALPYRIFRVYLDWLPEGRKFDLFVSGQDLPRGRQDKLKNIIKWCLRHKEGPETIGRFLAREIQAMNNPKVGKNIMCTFVPRAFADGLRIHPGGVLLKRPIMSTEPQRLGPVEVVSVHDRFALPPPFEDPRFVYIDDENKALPYHSPVYVVPGKVIGEILIEEVNMTTPPVVRVPDPGMEGSSSEKW